MYYINFNKLNENTQKEIIKLFKKYYSGVYDDRTLCKYIEKKIKNKDTDLKISLMINK
ncbi:MAG: hypothetical protein FWF92_02855 [Oscillospiraceae bacterium]|nr:hypothetical protein [Oscillospiraceae bacterium]